MHDYHHYNSCTMHEFYSVDPLKFPMWLSRRTPAHNAHKIECIHVGFLCTTVIKETHTPVKRARKANFVVQIFTSDDLTTSEVVNTRSINLLTINDEGKNVPFIGIPQLLRYFWFEKETIGLELKETL